VAFPSPTEQKAVRGPFTAFFLVERHNPSRQLARSIQIFSLNICFYHAFHQSGCGGGGRVCHPPAAYHKLPVNARDIEYNSIFKLNTNICNCKYNSVNRQAQGWRVRIRKHKSNFKSN
jgi:hypothetical protein